MSDRTVVSPPVAAASTSASAKLTSTVNNTKYQYSDRLARPEKVANLPKQTEIAC